MDGKKIYSITINGISESINAVEALNKQLETLESRIKVLEKSNVKVNSSGGSTKASNASSLSEEEKLAKQIEQIDAKREVYSKEIYQNYLAAKDVLKETVNDQKQIAAQERLQSDNYANTMAGMKQHLADIKSVMQTVDLGDTDTFQKMTKDANDLNSKLLEIEKSYGQYGRQVGNYANGVAEGLQKVKIAVGDDVREFDNAKQAAKALGNELKTMAVNGQQGTKEFKDLQRAVAQLNSDIKDATVSSKAMDNLLDTMQSFAAIGSVTQGMSALFGFDDAEIQKSIQKLVALQNVMQGIEKINQQMNSKEGIGGWFAKGNEAIDNFVSKITGASKAQKELNAATVAGKTASEGLAAAETAQATATAGATVATKALSFALKTLGIGLIVTAVAYLVENWEELYEWLTDTVPVLKNLGTWFDKIKAVAMGVGSAIVNYMVQPLATLVKVIQAVINGNFSEIPNIIGEGLKKTFSFAENYQKGYHKEVEKQQKAHNQKMLKEQEKANEEWLKDEEAKYGKSYERTKQYLNKQMELVNKQLANSKKGSKEYDALIEKQKDLQRKIWENERTEREKGQKKALADSKKYAKEQAEVEKELYDARLSAMKDGLNKTIIQLEEERRQRLAKIRANGKNYKDAEKEINAIYDSRILEAKKEWAKDIENVYKEMLENIKQINIVNTREILDSQLTMLDNGLDKIKDEAQKKLIPALADYSINTANINPKAIEDVFNVIAHSGNLNASVETVEKYIKKLEDLQRMQAILKLNKVESKDAEWVAELEKLYDKAEKELEEWLKSQNTTRDEIEHNLIFLMNKDVNYTTSLAEQYKTRILDRKAYYKEVENAEKLHAQAVLENDRKMLDAEYQQEKDAEQKRFNDRIATLNEQQSNEIAELHKLLNSRFITQEEYDAKDKEREDRFNKTFEKERQAHFDRLNALALTHKAESERIERDLQNSIKRITNNAYQQRLQEYRDFLSRLSEQQSSQPILDNIGFGVVRTSETRRQYREMLASYRALAEDIAQEKAKLQESLDKNEISFDDFQQAQRELNTLQVSVANATSQIEDNLKTVGLGLDNTFGQLLQSINQYVQAGLQAIQTIMTAFNDYQDYEFDKEQEALDKENELLEKKLDEQQDIIEKHKSAIDDIEDELSVSRGDRRQHLIDQLNAEIEAQRRAQAEEEKIKAEQEEAEKRQEELDKKRKQAEYKRNLMSILVSNAMAVANGLATQPFVPVGIAMGALAASLGAIQYALAAKQKPYAKGGQLDGGVAQGKRHSEGGIPVLGGRASIEGGEFITNRATTAKNVDLLEYINAKRKKLNIDDFIEFYSNGKAKKNIISMSPRAKFADGGVIPTLNNEYQFDDRLLSAFEDYSNRPVVVSVKEILNTSESIRRVETLAGLTPSTV